MTPDSRVVYSLVFVGHRGRTCRLPSDRIMDIGRYLNDSKKFVQEVKMTEIREEVRDNSLAGETKQLSSRHQEELGNDAISTHLPECASQHRIIYRSENYPEKFVFAYSQPRLQALSLPGNFYSY